MKSISITKEEADRKGRSFVVRLTRTRDNGSDTFSLPIISIEELQDLYLEAKTMLEKEA